MSYKLDKPYTDEQYADFVVEYNHNLGLTIEDAETAIYALEAWEKLEGNEVIDNSEEYQQEQLEKEKLRIQELFMTRSDFFDATIRAFGADEDDLLTAIGGVLTPMGIDNTEAKIALNNYKNALNFYRKHPLFTMLSNVNIPISAEVVINISSEQWDKFFDETNKKNPNAYKELLPSIE